ncbi:MAG: hypothetical protein M3Z22_05635, partial [Verrucomicrobiota bacterium]|nr:hypothetical protein [Verrucomicrobiota bacterium]
YDGAIKSNGADFAEKRQNFGVLSGTRGSTELMESYLQREHGDGGSLLTAAKTALAVWTLGNMALADETLAELPPKSSLAAEAEKQLASGGIEAALLERDSKVTIRYRNLAEDELRTALAT